MKPLLIMLVLGSALAANDGYDVYKRYCASCHMVMLPVNEPARSAASKQMKAPTMRMVAMRLKMMISIKNDDEDIQKKVTKAFIKEYIAEPDEEYVICMDSVVNSYGVMPPVEGMSPEEKEAVAEWLWEQY